MNKRQRKKYADSGYRSAFTGTPRVRRRAEFPVQRIRGQVYLRWGPSGWRRVRKDNRFERVSPGTLRRALSDLYRAIGRPVPDHFA